MRELLRIEKVVCCGDAMAEVPIPVCDVGDDEYMDIQTIYLNWYSVDDEKMKIYNIELKNLQDEMECSHNWDWETEAYNLV